MMDIKQKLELGYVLEVEIGEIRELAPLLFDSFVFSPTYVLNHNPM